MIDANKVKYFWEMRGEQFSKIPFESIANLEENPELLALKVKIETEQVLPRLQLHDRLTILDLGAGVGQWAFRFAPHVKSVTAVEYSKSLANIGIKKLHDNKIDNVKFVISPAENFNTNELFDVIFVSGLFVYMNDDQVEKLIPKFSKWVKQGGIVFLRDGVSILNIRHCIKDNFSSVLKTNYSALYRTRDEYVNLFACNDFSLIEDRQMFDEGCPLNKYPETRLWYYIFRR
jgi:cyclopropane fatty-acyl-phospholipid synthase-like methyltransferase